MPRATASSSTTCEEGGAGCGLGSGLRRGIVKLDASTSTLFFPQCIEPHDPAYLNTFIEHELAEARLLFWLAFLQDTPGWLY